MYSVLDRRRRKLSRETLFTPFGLKMNKLRDKKTKNKGLVGTFSILLIFQNFKCVLSVHIYILNSLSFQRDENHPKPISYEKVMLKTKSGGKTGEIFAT